MDVGRKQACLGVETDVGGDAPPFTPRFPKVFALLRPYVENKAGLTGQTVPGRRIPGHWPYPGPEELAEAELVGPDAWTFLYF